MFLAADSTAKTLTRVALDIPSCFMMFLWGTLAILGSIGVLLAPESKCWLTEGVVGNVLGKMIKNTSFINLY